MRNIILAMLALLLVLPLQAQEIKKSKLKVLYVAQNPETPDRYSFANVDGAEVWEKEIKKERAQEFHKFFKQYFEIVELVYGEDYNERITKKYDVVVFDAIPRQLDGELTKFYRKNASYISESYDVATIFIGGVAGPLTDDMDSKINVLCNCLDSHAYYYDASHPIFNTPFKVEAKTEMRPPNSGVNSYYTAKNLPEEMPMLRIQDVDEKYPPGVVSSPGFDDSPDAETIACGPSIKMVEAVSVGRHGNFLQWGYRADPRHLTESGKLMLINSIHYIAQFKGQKPFVKRTKPNRLTALDAVYKASDKGYAYEMNFSKRMHGMYNKALVRKLAGKSLDFDKYTLNRDSKFPDRTKHLKNVPKEIIEQYVDDWNAYLKYYEDNIGYLGLSELKEGVYGNKYQDIIIDEDLQKLGIANNDIQLLVKCISMLETNEQPELVQKLLAKYTTQSFTTAKEWRKWFKKNKGQLFFTETGGYKWMINILN